MYIGITSAVLLFLMNLNNQFVFFFHFFNFSEHARQRERGFGAPPQTLEELQSSSLEKT